MWPWAGLGELYGNGGPSEPFPSHQPPTPLVLPRRILPLGPRSSGIEDLSEPCVDPTGLCENRCSVVFLGFWNLKRVGAQLCSSHRAHSCLLDYGYFDIFAFLHFFFFFLIYWREHDFTKKLCFFPCKLYNGCINIVYKFNF